MVKQIFMRQVLAEINKKDSSGNAIPFSIEFRTFNRNNKMGGVLKKYDGAKLLVGKKLEGKPFVAAEHFYRTERVRKNPNHYENTTRNIETATGRIVKLNFRYITKFNGKEVIY